MNYDKPEDFYNNYAAFKRYLTPILKAKHVAWFDQEFWYPAKCTQETSVLELGSGTGEFLSYLKLKGVHYFIGVEQDANAIAVMEDGLSDHVIVGDIWDFFEHESSGKYFGCVVMFDVLEHFSAGDGVRLLQKVKNILEPDGRIIIRVPNMSSPWGGIHQYADLTHKTAFTPNSLEQLGQAAGLKALSFFPQRRGSPFRKFAECILHKILSKILVVTPVVWTPNMIAVLEKEKI
ncbi:MAG: class I SAM-dependent methyltransferase [Pseudomonadota bacterium]|nr:class I SAM-dependent methyltransferase [Pseudomonadota bacterium]